LGKAIDAFLRPDRVVVGIRSAEDKERLLSLWNPFTTQIEWMSVESAEMTKHALNAFLATSVAFINEIARIAEQVGADATEVERGLKSDSRIGRRAYLHPGAAFAGGTLARDVMFLRDIASKNGIAPALFDGVKASNDLHERWVSKRFSDCVGSPRNKRVGILGLTYKPGTSTLRRSNAVELCRWLASEGAQISAFDPAITPEEPGIPDGIRLTRTAEDVLDGADALLIATEWPEFRALSPDTVAERMTSAVVIDQFGHLETTLGNDKRIRYYAVGRAR
jgi:UDPglucose 6-dehydrogenase